jgi:hypothetical protein
MSSCITILPDSRETVNRAAVLCGMANRKVMKLEVANWEANCLRMVHNSDGPAIVFDMYFGRLVVSTMGTASDRRDLHV